MSHDEQITGESRTRRAAAAAPSASARWDASRTRMGDGFRGEEPSALSGRRPPMWIRLLVIVVGSLLLWSLVLAGARLLFR